MIIFEEVKEKILNIDDLKSFYKSFKYGTVLNGKKYYGKRFTAKIIDQCHILSVEEQIKFKIGMCYDTTSFSNFYLSKFNIEHECYFASTRMKYNEKEGIWNDPTHTFLIYKEDNKWKWLEGSWGKFKNNNLEESSKNKLVEYIGKELFKENGKNKNSIYLRKISSYPQSGISIHEFYKKLMKLPVTKEIKK